MFGLRRVASCCVVNRTQFECVWFICILKLQILERPRENWLQLVFAIFHTPKIKLLPYIFNSVKFGDDSTACPYNNCHHLYCCFQVALLYKNNKGLSVNRLYANISKFSLMVILCRAVTIIYFMFQCVDFGYDWCFIISLFKLMREKVLFKVRNRTFTDIKYCLIFSEIWIN